MSALATWRRLSVSDAPPPRFDPPTRELPVIADRRGRHGVRPWQPGVWAAAQLVNAGEYVGARRHGRDEAA